MLKNPKHEAFAQAVALGSSAAEAYRQHIASGKTSPATIETEGPTLARNPLVSLRIEELKGKVEEMAEKKFDLTKDKWLHRFVKIADQAEESGDFSAATGALDKIGKAANWYAPEKVEHSGSVAIPGLEEAVKSVFGAKP